METSWTQPKQGQLSTQLGMLDKAMSALHDTIEEMGSMLGPFSRQKGDSNCTENAPPPDILSPMADRVKILSESVNHASTRIRTIMDLLEL